MFELSSTLYARSRDYQHEVVRVQKTEIHDSGEVVSLDVEENDSLVNVLLSPDEAVAVAQALMEAAGVRQPEVSGSFSEGVLRVAIDHKKRVRFRYAKSDSSPMEVRTLDPYELKTAPNGNKLVVGFDPDRDNEIRAYRLDRIKGVVHG